MTSDFLSGLERLFQLGAVGAVLAFVLLRMEWRQGRVENAVDRLAEALLIASSDGGTLPRIVRHRAAELLNEIRHPKAPPPVLTDPAGPAPRRRRKPPAEPSGTET